MKNIIKYLFAFFLLIVLASCEKEEEKIYFEGGTPPALTSSVTGTTIPMTFNTKDDRAIRLAWTNPNYKFTTGVSSHNVSYKIEIDTTGANFTNPGRKVIVLPSELSLDLTQNTLNNYLINDMQLKAAMPHNIEIRVTSSLAGSSAALSSNVLKFTTTPFTAPPKVEPPTAGTLWATGDAFASGWSNPLGAPHNVNQKFTQVTPTIYELTVNMPGGGGYKLIQEQGNWDTQYHMTTGTWSEGDFEKKNSDPQFPGPANAGQYKITVDFQRGKYTVVKL